MLLHVVRTGCFMTESYTVTPKRYEFVQTPTRASDLCRSGGIIAALPMEPRSARAALLINKLVKVGRLCYNKDV